MSSDPAQRLNNQFQQTLIGGFAVATIDAVSLNDEDRRILINRVRLFGSPPQTIIHMVSMILIPSISMALTSSG
jgi:hypothetical protein